MSTAENTTQKTRTEGAVKGGNGKFIFPLWKMGKIDAGTGYSTAHGPVIEGERIQCGLIRTCPTASSARRPTAAWTAATTMPVSGPKSGDR